MFQAVGLAAAAGRDSLNRRLEEALVKIKKDAITYSLLGCKPKIKSIQSPEVLTSV